MSVLRPSPDKLTALGENRYSIYGLTVRSDLPLPELPEDEGGGDPDVEIRVGHVPAASTNDDLSFGPDGALLRIADIASYLIRDGREIIVEQQPHAADRNVRLYLLGSVMGVLLHQRGLLPLHANAVEIDGKAVVFMGESGAGKSTLAAWLHDAGHRIIADDVCVAGVDQLRSRSRVHPGLPRIRLWKDALELTGREPMDYEYSYAGDESYEKFDVPVLLDRAVRTELDLAAIYLLSASDRFGIGDLTGVDAVNAIFSHTYRGLFVPELGLSQTHFKACVELVRVTPIFLLERPRILGELSRDIEKIVSHARQNGSFG